MSHISTKKSSISNKTVICQEKSSQDYLRDTDPNIYNNRHYIQDNYRKFRNACFLGKVHLPKAPRCPSAVLKDGYA